MIFFCNDTATTEIYTLSLHDALPIYTDAERNKAELVEGIIDGLKWLGVDWDEGPFYQSQRTELYRAAAKKCVANGKAFLCYCPADKYTGGGHAQPAPPGPGGAAEARRARPAPPVTLHCR